MIALVLIMIALVLIMIVLVLIMIVLVLIMIVSSMNRARPWPYPRAECRGNRHSQRIPGSGPET